MSARGTPSRRGEWLVLAVLLLLALLLVPFNAGAWALCENPLRHAWALGSTLAFVLAWRLGALHRAGSQATTASVDEVPLDSLAIFYATQTGEAEALARRTRDALRAAGTPAHVRPLAELDVDGLATLRRALFIASTTGEGDPPDGATGFVRRVMSSQRALTQLQYGVLALGDCCYEDFCGFGRRLDAWLRARGAQPMFARIDVDDGDPAALENWREALAKAVVQQTLDACWCGPAWQAWRLQRRAELNPGSLGEPTFHLELAPLDGALPEWSAGDIAEVRPQHAPQVLARWFEATGLDPEATVSGNDGIERLRERLACSELPEAAAVAGLDPQQVADVLQELRPRDFSIASLPADGHLALLVRQSRRDDGSLGLASGWLTHHAAPHGCIALRLRGNPNFHALPDDVPMILIGNGTGLAGLRALLRERIAQGRRENWLLFGERQRSRDFYYRDELEAALAAGRLAHLDLAFSRDGEAPRYVQHLLGAHTGRLHDWLARGATIHVCGSRAGMAEGVHATLLALLGDDGVRALIEAGRYRRDVY